MLDGVEVMALCRPVQVLLCQQTGEKTYFFMELALCTGGAFVTLKQEKDKSVATTLETLYSDGNYGKS